MRPLLLAAIVASSAACSSGSPSSDGGAGGGGGSGGTVHKPDAGCQTGYSSCGLVCARVTDDSSHCGTCSNRCPSGSCVDGGCDADSGVCSLGGAVCGSQCVRDRPSNVKHCGSCFNQCASLELCADGDCTAPGGDGASCASPLLLDSDVERSGFFVAGTGDGTFTHTCGPLQAVPTKWFRFTSTKTSPEVSLKAAGSGDQLVLSVFSASACDAAVLVGCSDDSSEPTVVVPNALNQTYFVGVGTRSASAGAAASVRVDR